MGVIDLSRVQETKNLTLLLLQTLWSISIFVRLQERRTSKRILLRKYKPYKHRIFFFFGFSKAIEVHYRIPSIPVSRFFIVYSRFFSILSVSAFILVYLTIFFHWVSDLGPLSLTYGISRPRVFLIS